MKTSLQAGGHVQIFFNFVDGGDCFAQSSIWGEIERDGDGWELSLVIDGERFGGFFEMREGAERYGVAHGGTGCAGRVCSTV